MSLIIKLLKPVIVLPVLLLVSSTVLAQAYVHVIDADTSGSYTWLTRKDSSVLKSMKLIYEKPQGFNEVKGMECFQRLKESPRLATVLSCEYHQLHSDDGHFVSFFDMYGSREKKSMDEWKKLFPKLTYEFNTAHRGQIRAIVLQGLGKDATVKGPNANFDWEACVAYYTQNDAKSKFNADTAISLRLLTLENPKEYYKGKYKYLDALFIQKNDLGYVSFYCFYDEEGSKNLKKYWKEIEATLRFVD